MHFPKPCRSAVSGSCVHVMSGAVQLCWTSLLPGRSVPPFQCRSMELQTFLASLRGDDATRRNLPRGAAGAGQGWVSDTLPFTSLPNSALQSPNSWTFCFESEVFAATPSATAPAGAGAAPGTRAWTSTAARSLGPKWTGDLHPLLWPGAERLGAERRCGETV